MAHAKEEVKRKMGNRTAQKIRYLDIFNGLVYIYRYLNIFEGVDFMKYHREKERLEMQYRTCDNISDINDKLIMNLLDIKHTMRYLYEGRGSQKSILILLHDVKMITQRELTKRLGIQPGSVSEVLTKLENAGLIIRTTSKEDRRTANITLTENGEQMADEAANQRTETHREMFSCLTENERTEFLGLLEKINADWDQRYRGNEMHGHKGCHRGRHDMEKENTEACGSI